MAAHMGNVFDIRMLAMFCMAMRRDVFERVGPIDERYEVGMLEDDDYAMRVRKAGYRVVCAEDVFVHHFSQASFGDLIPTGHYSDLLKVNRERWERKWGIRWEPYQQRTSSEYQQLIQQIREEVQAVVPTGATVAVVSKGDPELLELAERRGWHFPQSPDGEYAGYYPADSADAIARLEELQARGADYLLLPRTAFWWLDHYTEFSRHLTEHYPRIYDTDACIIHCLS
jgi:hypothetical protein